MNAIKIDVRGASPRQSATIVGHCRWTPQEITERIHTLLQSPEAQERRVGVRERRESGCVPRFYAHGGTVKDHAGKQYDLWFGNPRDAATAASALNCVDELKWHAPGVDRRVSGVRERRIA